MAIQFNCPYCTATIRVPDSAMGKKGTCPKCGTKVLVPHVDIPPPPGTSDSSMEGVAANKAPAFGSGPPERSETGTETSREYSTPWPAAPPPDESVPAPFDPNLPAGDLFVSRPPLPLRRRRKRSGIVVPLLFIGLLLACAGYFYWQYRPRLEGELPASPGSDESFDPVVVGRGMIPLSDETLDAGLERLGHEPVRLASELMTVEFEGTDAGIRVTLSPGPASRFYSVDVSRSAALQSFTTRHEDEWNQRRREELAQSAAEMLAAYAEDGGDAAGKAIDYRDSVGLNALRGGLGYHVEAVAAGRIYACVYERDGKLFFPLPADTREFKIRGRTLPDGQTPFPGEFVARVSTKEIR